MEPPDTYIEFVRAAHSGEPVPSALIEWALHEIRFLRKDKARLQEGLGEYDTRAKDRADLEMSVYALREARRLIREQLKRMQAALAEGTPEALARIKGDL